MNGRNTTSKPYKVTILWRGDAEAQRAATPQNNRFHRVFEELAALGVEAERVVYDEAFAEEVPAILTMRVVTTTRRARRAA
jgi:hypothetical protein